MNAMKKSEPESDREIVIVRLIDAPVARVWRAWADDDEIVKWWGPHGFSDETEKREFKAGGHWRHTMIGPDGVRYPNYATYKELVENERIVLVNAGSEEDAKKGVGFRSEITFKAKGNKTELTMRSVFPTAAMRDHVAKHFKAVEGGHQTLARLAAQVEGDFVIFRMVDAPIARVWRAWTTEKELGAWMGPKGSEPGYAKLDFRVGGTYHYMSKFHGVDVWGLATYEVIEEPSKIVYVQQFSDKDRGLGRHPMAPTWPPKMRTTVHFQEFGARTLISLYWKPIEATEAEVKTFQAALEGMKGGWGGSFERLDELLKGGK